MSDRKERCSFCHKGRGETKKLIAGGEDNVFICDECVDLCNDILSEELRETSELEKQETTPEAEKQEILEIKKIDAVTFHNPEDWTYWDSSGRKYPGSASELGTYYANRRTRISIKERDGETYETEVFKDSRLTTYDDVVHIHFWIPKE